MALVDGFLELERSSGKLEWSAILQKMASDLGFSKILFGLLPKDSQDYENAFIVGNYPAAWREHYDRAGYARVDPTVSHCTQSVLPIFWERPSTRRESSTSSSRKPRPPAWCMG
ncbi:transcriptional activator protein LasR [Pseudomonas aeruginosa]|nr:transcriptional activator protein LasR [Pseudomonas aeruginosa]